MERREPFFTPIVFSGQKHTLLQEKHDAFFREIANDLFFPVCLKEVYHSYGTF